MTNEEREVLRRTLQIIVDDVEKLYLDRSKIEDPLLGEDNRPYAVSVPVFSISLKDDKFEIVYQRPYYMPCKDMYYPPSFRQILLPKKVSIDLMLDLYYIHYIYFQSKRDFDTNVSDVIADYIEFCLDYPRIREVFNNSCKINPELLDKQLEELRSILTRHDEDAVINLNLKNVEEENDETNRDDECVPRYYISFCGAEKSDIQFLKRKYLTKVKTFAFDQTVQIIDNGDIKLLEQPLDKVIEPFKKYEDIKNDIAKNMDYLFSIVIADLQEIVKYSRDKGKKNILYKKPLSIFNDLGKLDYLELNDSGMVMDLNGQKKIYLKFHDDKKCLCYEDDTILTGDLQLEFLKKYLLLREELIKRAHIKRVARQQLINKFTPSSQAQKVTLELPSTLNQYEMIIAKREGQPTRGIIHLNDVVIELLAKDQIVLSSEMPKEREKNKIKRLK